MIRLSAFADEYAKDLSEQIEGLKRNGISLLELRSIGDKGVADFTDEEAERYYEELKANGISVWSIGSPLGKVDIDCDFSEYEKKIRRIYRIANIMHTDKIRMFSFYKAYDQKEKVFEYLRKMCEIAKEYGVTLYHENEREIYGDTFERVLEIKENVPELKHVFDPANYALIGVDCKDAIDRFINEVGYFHIKDAIYSTGEIVPAGEGDGQFPHIIDILPDKDYVFTMEPHLWEFWAYASIDKAEMKHKTEFENGKKAFCHAVDAIKALLNSKGYVEKNGVFSKK